MMKRSVDGKYESTKERKEARQDARKEGIRKKQENKKGDEERQGIVFLRC